MKICVPIALVACSVLLWTVPAGAVEPIGYNRDIRPIFSEHCFACHGPDSASREAGLRLDEREAAIDAWAIVPEDPDSSELVRRIMSTSPHEVMPPPAAHKPLSDEQKQLLREWIAQGAEYEPHWSFIAPERPELPAVADAQWPRNPIDHFVLAELDRRGLAPAPEADRPTLARRLSLDLIGLPPEPEWVEQFVNDPSPDAYSRYVEVLLDKPQWGEHRARYWLDAARYADTHGIHFDNYREVWSYRQWVIEALNRNQPFDQFTIEQLAGDLLPEPELEQLIATGFNRCNITTNEGGVIPEEYAVLYTRDRTDTTAQVWLGLTAACAVCHDHKYDPLSQREYYELAAFFNNTTQSPMDGNVHDTPPIVPVPRPEDRQRWDELARELPDVRRQLDERRGEGRADFAAWAAADDPQSVADSVPASGLRLHAPLSGGEPDELPALLDGAPRSWTLSGGPLQWTDGHVGPQALRTAEGVTLELAEAGDFERDQSFSFGLWVKLSGTPTGSLVARMDEARGHRGWDLWVEQGRVGAHLVHDWPDDAIKVVSSEPLAADRWQHVLVSYDGSGSAGGLRVYVDGQRQATNTQADQLQGTIRTEVPLKLAQRHSSARLDGLALQDLRLYDRSLSAPDARQLAAATRAAHLAALPADERSEEQTDELYGWWLAERDDVYAGLTRSLAALDEQQQAIRERGTIAHVMQERDEEPTAYVLFRGEYDQRRDEVGASTPAILPPMPDELPRNRLGFAQWLLLPDHPLTARVAVNRYWQEVFGQGLVRTADDFGIAGELPSHPELLDWLAVEFRESGWDIKHLFRLLVHSSTYRQSAAVTPEKLEADPDNRLLSRGPRFRLDAEVLRDYALAASGLLVQKIGGPSVKPYQPEGVWEAVAMIGSNTRDYVQDEGDRLYRRSMYTFWKRSAPPASMEIFNAPARELCTVTRERTNTPLQALVTLNDPQFIEAARHLAQLALREASPSTDERLQFIALRLLARPLRTEELEVVRDALDELADYYRLHPDDARALLAVGDAPADAGLDAAELAGWTMVTNQLMNLDEVLNK